MQTLNNVTLSPDGKYVAFISSDTYKEFKGLIENRVILRKLAEGKEEIISDEGRANSSLSFSPDSSRLAYVSSEKERNYIVIRDVDSNGQESSMVNGKIDSLKWHDDTSMVALVEDYHKEEKKKKKEGNDGYFFEEDHKFHSLWKYTPGHGMRRLTSGFQVWDFSSLGNRAAAVVSEYPYNWSWYEPRIALIDLETGEQRTLYTPEKRQLSSPSFSKDGSKVFFIESLMSDNGVESGDIISCSIENGKAVNMTENAEKSFSCFKETANGVIYALGNNMGTFEIQSIGEGRIIWSSFGAVLPAFSPKFSSEGGLFAFAFTAKDRPQEVYLVDGNGEAKKLTDVNSHLSGLRSYDSKMVKWKSTDGVEPYGLFRNAGEGAPLVVVVHGGPTSASTENFMDYSTLLMGAGFSVFLPNYRGSTGKGRKYAELNRGDMGGMDFKDIMEGLDYVLENEPVDRDRIFITGGSYGGFISAWAVTQTDRFAASASLFGIVDWISFHGVSSLATWDSIHYDQDPYAFDRFLKFSAIRYVENVKTPILLMHGIEDPYVPVGQYYQFYRALKDKGKEARLLLFPREGHGFREKKHFEMYITEMIRWFNSIPSKTGDPQNTA